MDLIGPISEIFKCVCSPICEYFDYYRKLHENVEELDRVLRELENKKKDIEATLSRAESEQGKKPSNEVSDWLKNVQRINTKAESFKQEVEKGNCFSRACLGKDVEKKIEEVKEYIQKGCAFTSCVSDAPSTSGMTLSTTSNLVGERTGKIVKEIWEDLIGDKVSKIGVWGMGGIGKTTIMSHINNKLQEKPNKFNDVIWVTVSQPLDLFKLQTEIATALKQSLPENEDKVRRAGRLLGMLKAKEKFVLILDMWEAFPLQEIGIPEPSEENGCKLVITTRLYRVCRSMKCKQVAVELLSKQEAFNLFIDGVGSSILQVPILNKEIINEVVEERGCLPLAIVTVAASMSGEEEIYE
ncbi:hypothetical protein WN944_022607 [Citrus x changshan-huyou]|uniref:NB-ARC domain-containing protein n=1 Tax=Citrus x changshan-huyou TaxID=2935761 RepID=A0AAP0N139_9ROSI